MDNKTKQVLASNWFKILQDLICKEIEELEGKKNIFKYKSWKRSVKKKEGGGRFMIRQINCISNDKT